MKKVTAFVISLLMLLTIAQPARAEGTAVVSDSYEVMGESLVFIASSSEPVSCSINGIPMDSAVLSTLEQQALPVTYLLIADASTALSNNQKQQQTDALNAVADSLRPQDTMILGFLGNALQMGEPQVGQSKAREALAGTWPKASVTMINDNMKQLTEYVRDSGLNPAQLCILVLSDGIDDANSKNAEQEALEAVRASGLTIHTLALVDPNPTNYARARAEYFNQFSAAAGGSSATPNADGSSPADFAASVVRTALGRVTISIPGGELDHSGSDVTISFACGGNTSAVTIPASVIAGFPEPEPETEPTTEPETEPESTLPPETVPPEAPKGEIAAIADTVLEMLKNPGQIVWTTRTILICCIAGTLLLLIILCLLLLLTRKGSDGVDDVVFIEDDEKPARGKKRARRTMPVVIQAEEADPTRYTIRVLAQPDNYELVRQIVTNGRSLTFGRTDRADYVLNSEDTKLSGVHFEIQLESGMLRIRDRVSTNGTCVNGADLEPNSWTEIADGALITAGSMDYLLLVDSAD